MKVLLLGDNQERCANYIKILEERNIPYSLSLNDLNLDEYTHLIIPGGIDVDPSFYHKEKDPTVKMVDHAFDLAQFRNIDHFIENKKPILGICRGHQILNIVLGGTLIQDIKTGYDHRKSLSDEENSHPIIIEEGNYLYDAYGKDARVNSTHHQAIDILGKGLIPIAYGPDGTNEACIHDTLPIITVQFHPERLAHNEVENDIDGNKIFDYFFKM